MMGRSLGGALQVTLSDGLFEVTVQVTVNDTLFGTKYTKNIYKHCNTMQFIFVIASNQCAYIIKKLYTYIYAIYLVV